MSKKLLSLLKADTHNVNSTLIVKEAAETCTENILSNICNSTKTRNAFIKQHEIHLTLLWMH